MDKKILILDDKETIAKVIAVYLANEFDLVYFSDAVKGLKWLEEGNRPDLIISDIKMPLISGEEFLRILKSNISFSSIPVVILSSEDNTTERIRLFQEGAEDYILKPFNPTELKCRIKKIIQ